MPIPFSGSIVGSWLFVRSTRPNFEESAIYHFTADGTNYWETEYNGRRLISSLKYECSEDTLTLIYGKGPGSPLKLTLEDDGTVRIPNASGDHVWWMVRLTEPKPYSIAFVGEDGAFTRLASPKKQNES